MIDSRFLDWGGSAGFPGWAHAIIKDEEGLLWMSTSEGLVRFDGVSFLQTATTPQNYGEFRRMFMIDGQIYLGDHDKPLHRYAPKSSTHKIEQVTWPYAQSRELNIWSSYEHHDGRVLLADHNGIIYEYNREEQDVSVFFEMPANVAGVSGLKHTARLIQSDPFDREKIWVCSKQGMFHIKMTDSTYDFYRPIARDGLAKLKSDDSFAFHDHIQIGRDIWISTYGNGLVRFNTIDKSWASYRYEPPYKTIREDANFILSHIQLEENFILIGSRDLKIFDIKQKKFFDFNRRHGGYNASSVPTVWMYPDGKEAIYMITGGVLSKYSNQHNQFLTGDLKSVLLRKPSNSIIKVKKIADQKILLLDNLKQVYEWDAETLSTRLSTEYNQDVWSNSETSEQSYSWQSNHDTLVIHDKTSGISVDLFLEDTDLSEISSVHIDHNEHIWLCSADGLIKYSQEDNSYTKYNQRHGLLTSDWTKSGLLKAFSDNSIFASTGNQFVYFHPDDINEQTNKLQPYVCEIEVYDDSKLISHHVDEPIDYTLGADEDYFSINYSALEQTHTGNLEFQYKLVGYDGIWINGRQDNIASYTNVPPGTYDFEVRAKRQGGLWSLSDQKVTIDIEAKLKETVWFKILIACGLLALIYLAYRYRIKKVREEEQLRSYFQQELAEVKLEALRSQMNPHFLFNSLNSIDHYILNNKPQEASEYLAKFSKLVRKTLEFSKRKSLSIKEELDTLQNYIHMEQMRFSKQFFYSVHVNEGIDINAIQIPPLLLQPYVENAIWHGLMHLEDREGKLQIEVAQDKDHIVLSIDDNGIGREKSKAIKSKSATKRKSFGIKINEDRIRLNNELSNLGGHAKIIDKYDEHNKPNGTRVLLSLPKIF